jgi:carbon starvation protein CstA
MITFFIGIGILIFGYLVFGALAESQFGPDHNRITPAVKNNAKFEDRQVLPHWKCMLLHLLHIAGVGPVVGVVLGAKFGAVVFLIIPIGNIIGGMIHDYFSGMISLRNGASSYLEISKKFFGKSFAFFATIFMMLALIALVTSFTNVSAGLLNKEQIFYKAADTNISYIVCICAVFLYYILSTFFPISSFVSKLSNVFGIILLVSTVSILFFVYDFLPSLPEFDIDNFFSNFTKHPQGQPIVPMLFVTIACGIISGFHGTQNPITAGIESNEKNGKHTFCGMMAVEGFLAMVWAAVGIIGYSQIEGLAGEFNGTKIISEVVNYVVNSVIFSKIILFSIVILAVTTADAALRVLRILISETFGFQQRSAEDRFLLCLPILGVCVMAVFWSNIIPEGFMILWNYFSLTNQVMAVIGLAIATCYMRSKKKSVAILLVPFLFLSFVVFCYLFWISPQHIANAPIGFGLNYSVAFAMALICTLLAFIYCMLHGKHLSKLADKNEFQPDEG